MSPPRREDVLVSVCFAAGPRTEAEAELVRQMASQIDARYRFWEVIVVLEPGDCGQSQVLAGAVRNLRLLQVRSTRYYRNRVVATAEAIGDVVVLAAVEELPALDLVAMIDEAAARNCIVHGRRSQSSMLNPFILAVGRSSGFRVTSRDMQTAAYPRTLLNKLLAHSDNELALRFTPMDSGFPVCWQAGNSQPLKMSSRRELGRRLQLLHKLLVNSAPVVISSVALTAAIVAVIGLVFAIYALMSWAVRERIEPGWLSTSLMLSFLAMLLGLSLFGLAMGMQRVIQLLTRQVSDDVIGETSVVDIFHTVTSELNVEVAGGPMPAAAAGWVVTPADPSIEPIR